MQTESEKMKNRVFDGLTRGPVKIALGLVVGVVILSGTGLYFGPSQPLETMENTAVESVHDYEQQRSADSLQERIELREILDSKNNNVVNVTDYEQQRAADSLQERVELREILDSKNNNVVVSFSQIHEERKVSDRQGDL